MSPFPCPDIPADLRRYIYRFNLLSTTRSAVYTGDSFAVQASLEYMGDFMSGAGDEGGVGYAAELRNNIESFHGHVESWDPKTRCLVYKPNGYNPNTLGTSRPIINRPLPRRTQTVP